MAQDKNVVKYFSNLGGLDLRSPDALIDSNHATEAINVDIRNSGALNKRKGYQCKTTEAGGFGMTTFANLNVTTGAITKEILVVDSALKKLTEENLTITYSGGGVAQAHIYLHTDNNFYCDLYEDGSRVFNQSLGDGVDEASAYTLAQLDTAIDGIANFSAAVSGTSTFPAAFLELTELSTISGTLDIPYKEYINIDGQTGLFATSQTNKNDVEFQNASFAHMDNVLYVATGYDDLVKYDGSKVYKAGMPQGTVSNDPALYSLAQTATVTGAQSATDTFEISSHDFVKAGFPVSMPNNGTGQENAVVLGFSDDGANKYIYLDRTISNTLADTTVIEGIDDAIDPIYGRSEVLYKTTYEYVDAKGNTIEGILSDASTAIAGQSVASNTKKSLYQIPRLELDTLAPSTKYNTDYAIANLDQYNVNTFNVDSGHGIVADDKIYFADQTGTGQERTVASVTATSITFSGDASSIFDNAEISNNLRINVWRNASDSGTTYYLVGTYPNSQSTLYHYETVQDTGNTYLCSIANTNQPTATGCTFSFIEVGVGTIATLTEGVDFNRGASNLEFAQNLGAAIGAISASFTSIYAGACPTASGKVVFKYVGSDAGTEFRISHTYTGLGPCIELINGISTTSRASGFYMITHGGYDGILSKASYTEPIKAPGLPPKGRFISTFRNQLIISGNLENPNNVYYSTTDGPEYFPSADNSFLVDTLYGDKITGIAPLRNTFMIFKDQSLHALTGDLALDSFRIDFVSKSGIGCLSHHSITEVDGRLFFLTKKGIYAVDSSANEPLSVSAAIESRFTRSDQSFNFTKAVGFNWLENNKYLLFMPVETQTTNYHNTSDSRVFCYDYSRNAWLEWNNIDFGGGIAQNEDIYFVERRYDTNSTSVLYYNYQILNSGNASDYNDHSSAISFSYKSHWESLGEPSIYKKFLRINVHASDTVVDNFESDTFTLGIKTENDFNVSTKSNFTLNFTDGSGGYLPAKKGKLWRTKARSMRFIFENSTLSENILINGYEVELVAPFKMEFK